MKKLVVILMAFIMPVTYILFHCTMVDATFVNSDIKSKGIAKFDGSKIVAWKQLDYAKLVLANGQTIAEVNTKSTLDTVKLQNPVDICFVLDVSGSMYPNEIETLKSATQTLIVKLGEKFDNPILFRVAVIHYDNNVKILQKLESYSNFNIEDLINNIGLSRGSTHTGEAINEASNLWSLTSNLAEYKYNILITDGMPNGNVDTKQSIIDFKNTHEDINFLTIFVGELGKDKQELFKNSDDIIFTDKSNFAETIINGIWNFIFWNYIDADNITTVQDASNVFYTNDSYVAIVDEELIYGATLIMQYSIHVKTVEKLKYIEAIDYVANGLVCTSANYQGYYINDNAVKFEIDEFNNEQSGDNYEEEIVIKLNFSRVLSSENDVEYVNNTAYIKAITDDGREFETDTLDTNGESNVDTRIRSNKLMVIPPFGQRMQDKIRPYVQKGVVILTLSTIPIIVKIKKIRSKENGKCK